MANYTNPIAPLPRSRSTVWSGNAICAFSMATWAASFPAAEVLLNNGWDPLFLIIMRYVVTIGVLLPVWTMVEGHHVVMNARWVKGLWIGGFAFGLGAYLILLAQSLTDPVLVAVIASAMPIGGALIELMLRERRITRWFFVGMVATCIGGVVATGGNTSGEFGWGVLAAIASTFIFAWGSHAAVREFPDLSTLGRTSLTFTGAALAVFIAGGIAWSMGYDLFPAVIVTDQNITMLSIYAVVGMVISQYFWLKGVDRLGIALASFHINTSPFYVMLFMVALGAVWSWPAAIGAGIVALGVLAAQRG